MLISATSIPIDSIKPTYPDLIVCNVSHPSLSIDEKYVYNSQINADTAKEIFLELGYNVELVPPPENPPLKNNNKDGIENLLDQIVNPPTKQ